MEHVEWGAVITMAGKIALIIWQAITAIVAVLATQALQKGCQNGNGNGGKEVKEKDGRQV